MKNSIYKGQIKRKIFLILSISVFFFNPIMITNSQESDEFEIVEIYGIVVYVELEGGFFGIVSNTEEQYEVINLPIDLQKDELSIHIIAKIRSDLASIYMWGIIIEISEIIEFITDTSIQKFGDVNNDGDINIIDALLIAQYYVGLAPIAFDPRYADLNLDGKIDILDALLIVQYYIAILPRFPCDNIPLIEGSWFLQHYNWQGNVIGEEFITIKRIGNQITIISEIDNEVLGVGSLIINNLGPPYQDRSKYIIKGIDLRELGIENIFIYDDSNMETELPLAESSNPSVFSRVVRILGEYQLIPNPPLTSPAIPGMVYGLIADKNYILTNNNSWYWSEENPEWKGSSPKIGDMVDILGYRTIRTDITGNSYYELEVLQLRTNPNVVQLDIFDDNSILEVNLGTCLRITLEENPSTGYRWEYSLPEGLLELISDNYIPPEDIIPGAPGTRIITLKTIATTEYNFYMEYIRPGEEIPINEFSIDLVVI
ncbi:MAG: protease inhibitor I42 family protein [Candidatus Lokiarchaeota archaeon]|nr:protease inhibitor I42 family protein [Candidatus Lokiarchaeota archaeon]